MYLDHMSKFEVLETLYGEEEANRRFEAAVGKYVIVEAREDNTTRLFIKSTNDITNARTKDGWWNTFSICKSPCNKGFYIGEVSELRHDKYGYPIFVIQIKCSIDDDFMSHEPFVHVVAMSHLFLNEFDNLDSRNNYDALIELGVKHGYDGGCNIINLSKYLMELFMDSKISIKDIDNAANTATQYDINCQKITDFFNNGDNRSKYPLLFAKKDKESFSNALKYNSKYASEDAYWFMSDIVSSANSAVDKGFIPAMEDSECYQDFIERYLHFNQERKKANKAAKTAAKKAKKAAKKDKGE